VGVADKRITTSWHYTVKVPVDLIAAKIERGRGSISKVCKYVSYDTKIRRRDPIPGTILKATIDRAIEKEEAL
jgi:hypothetical protein